MTRIIDANDIGTTEEAADAKLEVSCTVRKEAIITIENAGKHYLFGQLYEKVSTSGLLQLSIEEADELSKKLAVLVKDAQRYKDAINNGNGTFTTDFNLN